MLLHAGKKHFMAVPYAMASYEMPCRSCVGPMQPSNEVYSRKPPRRRAKSRVDVFECTMMVSSLR
jgi:hypothetical protein